MPHKIFLALAALALTSFQAHAQADKPIQRKDSVTVSAGISKEQLALESQLDGVISQGDQALHNGNSSDAIRHYAGALDLVHRQPLLADRESWVLNKLASGYMQGNRPKDAIPIYSKLLNAKKSDCESESAAVSNCGDAQYRLGAAKAYAGDFQGALALFRDAEANYAKAEKSSNFHEFTLIQVKNQGQTKLWIAIAFSRLGKTLDALAAVEAAIPQLTRVQSDESILIGIRDDAARSLRDAQTLLTRLKSTR